MRTHSQSIRTATAPSGAPNMDERKWGGKLLSAASAATVGIVLCILLSLLSGAGPFDLLGTIWKGSWGSMPAIAATFAKMTPLLLTGLAVSMAYRVNLLNIGCEGQLTLGALASASFSLFASSLPGPLLAPLTILVGAAVGGLWAFPAVWLRQRHSIHEVISTLLLNYIAIYLAEYLVLGPLGDGTPMGRTQVIPEGAMWQAIWKLGHTRVTLAPIFAFLLACGCHIWLYGTCWGFEVRATGSNSIAANSSGIPVKAWQRRLFVLSGALAGLAGALEIVAVHHRFYRAFSPGYGFDGITTAFLAAAVPGWLWLSALLPASLRVADKLLQLAMGISPNTILVIQAALLLTVAAGSTGAWAQWLLRAVDRRESRPDTRRPKVQ